MSFGADLGFSVALCAGRCENRPVVSVEQELIARALEGDGRAFAALVEPHLGMLYRIAARAGGSRTLAEDAVQEALTVAYQRLRRYQPGTSFGAFLAAIAVKKAHTLLRGERRRKRREQAADKPERVAEPGDLLAAERVGRRIRQALKSMPKKRREAALLRLDGGMSYEEIGRAIGSTAASARVLVHLALKQLREELEQMILPESGR